MISFESDYTEGCIPQILEALSQTNTEQTTGYGLDPHSDHARALIRKACEAPEADIQFLVGGTQANLTVIASILRPYQGVLCAETGHINVHETGAIEATGHKCLALPETDGKITAAQIETAIISHQTDETAEHIVAPGMIYLSWPTETGTLYTKEELTAISGVARKYSLPLFVDGARMGYGLAARDNDLTLADFARLCDVFYIGGTKVGALFGEAVVISSPAIARDFRYMIKQRGGMLAKGRLLGIQFEELFRDNCYLEISKNAMACAERLVDALKEKGYSFYYTPQTNQIFPILTNEKMRELRKEFAFHLTAPYDEEHIAVRFVTSWLTKQENVDALIAAL